MGEYFRFKVQLVGVKPPVFRRFLLTTKATFHELHVAIQIACGWKRRHDFAFVDPRHEPIAVQPDESAVGFHPFDASEVLLSDWFALKGNRKCFYEYDFDDMWRHEVHMETIEQHDGKWKRRLADGARAFPIEDSGGVTGYRQCLKVLETGRDPHDLVDLIGHWTPEQFDIVSMKRKFDR